MYSNYFKLYYYIRAIGSGMPGSIWFFFLSFFVVVFCFSVVVCWCFLFACMFVFCGVFLLWCFFFVFFFGWFCSPRINQLISPSLFNCLRLVTSEVVFKICIIVEILSRTDVIFYILKAYSFQMN